MKISINWLKDYVPIEVDPHLISEKLSLAGFEVEEVIEKRLDFPNIVVGKVVEVEKHPNADKLTVCKVDAGIGTDLNIICGAPNVEKDQIVAVALIGADLPNGMRIHKAKIRGIESEGMICSEKELGVSENAEGIWVLSPDLTIGKPLAEALEFETDFILDIAITPNRPDGLGHIGIAREVAAIFDLPFHKPEPEFTESGASSGYSVGVEIQSPESCPRYAARLIKNIKVESSPLWLMRRLESIGMRPINNIVDITNYIMMETGQPLHAFDYDLLDGGKIVVRESKASEKFITLDDKEHELQEGTVLICDAQKPVAIGGIMGGLNSEVSNETRNILLESAYFAPQNIQRSLRYLEIGSEASQRFERGTDPNGIPYAQDRATELMIKIAGGQAYKSIDNYPSNIYPVEIPLKHEQINTLLGTDLSLKEMSAILQKIEIETNGDKVKVPTFRPDLERVSDLAEEISRLYGLDNIAPADKSIIQYDYEKNRFDQFVDHLKTMLTGMGLQEVITNSMINKKKWEELTGEKIYPILNPVSHDMSGMRNSLLLSLLNVMQWNVNRQIKDLKIFEINRIYQHSGSLKKLPDEELRLAMAMTGNREPELWYSARQLIDFYSVKGVAESVIDKISLDNFQLISYDNFVVEGQSMAVKVDGKIIGYFGRIKDKFQQHFDIETPVFVADFDVRALYNLTQQAKIYKPIAKYPHVERDLAIIVDEALEAGKLIQTIENENIPELKEIFIFDVYKGEQIEMGKKSIALRFNFQSMERTLTEEEVTASINKIVKITEQKHQGKIRL